MLEQLANGDRALFAFGELGDVLRDQIVEVNLALVEQNHHRRRGCDDLGERGQIVDRALGNDRRALAAPRQSAEALLPHGGATTSNDNRRARIPTRRNSALDDVIDLGQALGGHADGTRRLYRKTVARGGDTWATAGSKCKRGQQQREHQRVSWEAGQPEEVRNGTSY